MRVVIVGEGGGDGEIEGGEVAVAEGRTAAVGAEADDDGQGQIRRPGRAGWCWWNNLDRQLQAVNMRSIDAGPGGVVGQGRREGRSDRHSAPAPKFPVECLAMHGGWEAMR